MYDFKYFDTEGIWEHEPDEGLTITLPGGSNGYDGEHLQVIENALAALEEIVPVINTWMLTWFLAPSYILTLEWPPAGSASSLLR